MARVLLAHIICPNCGHCNSRSERSCRGCEILLPSHGRVFRALQVTAVTSLTITGMLCVAAILPRVLRITHLVGNDLADFVTFLTVILVPSCFALMGRTNGIDHTGRE